MVHTSYHWVNLWFFQESCKLYQHYYMQTNSQLGAIIQKPWSEKMARTTEILPSRVPNKTKLFPKFLFYLRKNQITATILFPSLHIFVGNHELWRSRLNHDLVFPLQRTAIKQDTQSGFYLDLQEKSNSTMTFQLLFPYYVSMDFLA